MRVLPEHFAALDRVAAGDGLRAHLISRELEMGFFLLNIYTYMKACTMRWPTCGDQGIEGRNELSPD